MSSNLARCGFPAPCHSVSAGFKHSAAVDCEGKAYVWGANNQGAGFRARVETWTMETLNDMLVCFEGKLRWLLSFSWLQRDIWDRIEQSSETRFSRSSFMTIRQNHSVYSDCILSMLYYEFHCIPIFQCHPRPYFMTFMSVFSVLFPTQRCQANWAWVDVRMRFMSPKS